MIAKVQVRETRDIQYSNAAAVYKVHYFISSV